MTIGMSVFFEIIGLLVASAIIFVPYSIAMRSMQRDQQDRDLNTSRVMEAVEEIVPAYAEVTRLAHDVPRVFAESM